MSVLRWIVVLASFGHVVPSCMNGIRVKKEKSLCAFAISTVNKTFEDSRQLCKDKYGGDLLVLSDGVSYHDVAKALIPFVKDRDQLYLIGLNRRDPKVWRNSFLPYPAPAFIHDHPLKDDCVSMNISDGTLVNRPCDPARRIIVEGVICSWQAQSGGEVIEMVGKPLFIKATTASTTEGSDEKDDEKDDGSEDDDDESCGLEDDDETDGSENENSGVTEKTDTIYTELLQQLKSMTELVNNLTSRVDELSNDVTQQANEVDSLRDKEDAKVAFAAGYNKKMVSFGGKSKLFFDQVSLNNGGAYSWITGDFTAPVDGIYSFTLFITTVAKGDIHILVQVNGKTPIARLRSCNDDRDDQSSVSSMVMLKKGDKVGLWHLHGGPMAMWMRGHTQPVSVFSGFLYKSMN